MSLRPNLKYCSKCGTFYSLNPSVGVFGCPRCLKKAMDRVSNSGMPDIRKRLPVPGGIRLPREASGKRKHNPLGIPTDTRRR